MKPYIIIIITLFAFFSCKAQSPIVPLDTRIHETPDGSYLKDLNNELNKFVGTWKYENGNTSFTIIFQKKVQVYNDEWYEDMLIGEYKYVDNGVEIVNLLDRLNNPILNNPSNYYEFNITGNTILKKGQKPSCEECDISERRILMFFDDPERKYLSHKLAIRYINENVTEKIEAILITEGSSVLPYENAPQEARVPDGTYTFILITKTTYSFKLK